MKLSAFGGHLIEEKVPSISESMTPQSALKSILKTNVDNLKKLGITDYEQIVSIASNKMVRPNLAASLNNGEEDLFKILEEISREIDENAFAAAAATPREFHTGAFKPTNDENRKIEHFEAFLTDSVLGADPFATKNRLTKLIRNTLPPASLASSVNYVRQLPRVRNQVDRGTCVAYAVTCINEFAHSMYGKPFADLSEQHLYYEAKLIDPNPDACGTWVSSAMSVLATKGQCTEALWSYNPNLPCNQPNGKPSNADQNALQYVNLGIQLNPSDAMSMKNFLTLGSLIAFAIPVYKSWLESAETVRSGRITMPLPDEIYDGGHAMAMVGYQDQEDYPGGGYFIIRNSWGEQYWGNQNVYAPGYGTIPYEYIKKYNWEAFCIG